MSAAADSPSTLVLKLGGEVVSGSDLPAIAADIGVLAQRHRVVVVHGGGPQATALSRRLGIEPRVIAGRRVTDSATLDVMKMTVAGQVNVDLCATLARFGVRAVGLHGASDGLVLARKRPARVYDGAGDEPVDLGHVGDIVSIGLDLLETLLGSGRVPVVACIGAGADGAIYNINGDIVGNRIAIAMRATLVLVTEARGVLAKLDDPQTRWPRLSAADARSAIESGAIRGGMIPKLTESFAAMAHGVQAVHIVGKLAPGELVREIEDGGSVGTMLLPAAG